MTAPPPRRGRRKRIRRKLRMETQQERRQQEFLNADRLWKLSKMVADDLDEAARKGSGLFVEPRFWIFVQPRTADGRPWNAAKDGGKDEWIKAGRHYTVGASPAAVPLIRRGFIDAAAEAEKAAGNRLGHAELMPYSAGGHRKAETTAKAADELFSNCIVQASRTLGRRLDETRTETAAALETEMSGSANDYETERKKHAEPGNSLDSALRLLTPHDVKRGTAYHRGTVVRRLQEADI